jgi:hypothetical protein
MSKTAVNRSQEIRNYLAENPGSKPKEVIAGLKKKGVRVTNDLVNYAVRTSKAKAKAKASKTLNIKTATKKKRGPGRPKASKNKKKPTITKIPKTTAQKAAEKAAETRRSNRITATDLRRVKEIIIELGGLSSARELINEYEDIFKEE